MLIRSLFCCQPTAVAGSSVGGVAQLGERLNGIQEVRGSIPLTSMQAAFVVRFGLSVEVVRVSHRLIR